MKNLDPFNQKLELYGYHIPHKVRDAAVFVTDTLELSWASAQSVFGDKATPEIALAIYDRVIDKMRDYDRDKNDEDDADMD
jgi:hypothetical protein